MIPVYLAPQAVRIALVGRSDRAVSRLGWLRDAGAAADIWSDEPTVELVNAAGPALRRALPGVQDLQQYRLIWVADLPPDLARRIAVEARAAGVLINVEDARDLCDFHSPALVRRGALTLAVGTGGASPAVARAARERLEQVFPDAWGEALHTISQSRNDLRGRGASSSTLAADARAQLSGRGLI